MKFLVDAQLPYLLATVLRQKGFDALHTDDLPAKDETPDQEIRLAADRENRIVIFKDSDFQNSYLVNKSPERLLLITTGNIKNRQLLDLFRKNLPVLLRLFEHHRLIEMNNEEITAHE